jgi:uncharacterized membrane protein
MEIEELLGLPAHPLLVHLPVVLVPLAALGVVAMAIRPAWLKTIGWAVAGVAGTGFLGALVASGSGEALEDDLVASGQTIGGTLSDHAEMGETAPWVAGLFFALALAWVVFAWWRRRTGEEQAVAKVRKPGVVGAVLMVLALLSGAAATIAVVRTGHSGAESVWETET